MVLVHHGCRARTDHAIDGRQGAIVDAADSRARARSRPRFAFAATVPSGCDPCVSLRWRGSWSPKTFVAALVLRLVEEGKLRLDHTVERWLPGLVPNGRAITVRQLLPHTSGLYDYVEEPSVLRSPRRRWTPEELIALATAHPVDRVRPRRFSYSSTNYLVVGRIADKAGGAPLATQLRRQLFDPLELGDTTFEPGLVRGPYVHGHRPPSHNGVVTGPPEDTSDEMNTGVPAGRLDHGLGIAALRTPCGAAWGHTGNAQGAITVAWNTADASR
jgi:D-alanyl-D-alanine carboxypeptidase